MIRFLSFFSSHFLHSLPTQQVTLRLYRPHYSGEEDFYPGITIMGPSNLNLEVGVYSSELENDVEVRKRDEVTWHKDNKHTHNRYQSDMIHEH
jgi:hypothetical protein